jgi:glycosyltransferase involved in cell wall biosynthesis
MKILLSHPTGNAFVRSAAQGFLEAGILGKFYTTVATFPGSTLNGLSKLKPLAELGRRGYEPSLKPFTRSFPLLEFSRIAASKAGFSTLIKHETGIFSVDAVYRSLDKKVASDLKKSYRPRYTSVYAYEDGALYSFREAKKQQLDCLYDLPIGYWRSARKLLGVERERWPEWAPTITGFLDSAEKLEHKDEELRLADEIFVASHFTKKTLDDFPGKLSDIHVVPYGFPPIGPTRGYSKISPSNALKLLFVGSLSQRKGVADMFAAVEILGDKVELTVVGHKASNNCPALDKALAKHTWIPSLPHHEILKLMREHDVLIFPSLFEGFGLVITEAMSQGTPVITTDRTAGPDLITHGENGWLVEPGSTMALKQAIEELLYQPEIIKKVGLLAKETARLRPWELYGQQLTEAIIKKNK